MTLRTIMNSSCSCPQTMWEGPGYEARITDYKSKDRAVLSPTGKSREFYLHDDVTFPAKWLDVRPETPLVQEYARSASC